MVNKQKKWLSRGSKLWAFKLRDEKYKAYPHIVEIIHRNDSKPKSRILKFQFKELIEHANLYKLAS